jgi:hypothetical protein
LALALACGATHEQAAQKAGVSPRTLYRRLREAAFLAQVREARTEMERRTTGLLTAAGIVALKTLTGLQDAAAAESVRLGAARTILDLGCKFRENLDVAERLKALEARLDGLLADPEARDGADIGS